MKRGFYTIMAAQFFSSLADNALFVAAVELLKTSDAPKWQPAALVPMFALWCWRRLWWRSLTRSPKAGSCL